MKQIKKINIFSMAKIAGLLLGGSYLLLTIVINSLIFLMELIPLRNLDFMGFLAGLLAGLLVSLLIGGLGFIIGGLWAWLYNITAGITGGIIWEEIVCDFYKKNTNSGGENMVKPKETARPQEAINHILSAEEKSRTETASINDNFLSKDN